MMTLDNTKDYTQAQLPDAINEEFEIRFARGDWSDDRAESEKWFADEVSRRRLFWALRRTEP